MDRQRVTDILNQIITLKGEIYDIYNQEGDSRTKERLSRTIDYLEESEKPLKENLTSF